LRIRDYVNTYGVDAFNQEDFFFVGSKVSQDPSRLVLVGGQAIEAWGLYFKVLAPSGNSQPLTEDTDWYGTPKDAVWLCRQLGKINTELTLSGASDPSPNTGVAFHRRPDGRVVLIDFLKSLKGLTHDKIVGSAVPVQIGPVKLHILHPLLCLESRLANLAGIESKRNGNGIMQANWSVDIASAYLQQMLSAGKTKDAMIACREIVEAAEYRSGPYCYDEFNIDPVRAITSEMVDNIGGLFASEDWPRRVARLEKSRSKRIAQKLRLQNMLSYRFSLS
jgi:hypothetical protein